MNSFQSFVTGVHITVHQSNYSRGQSGNNNHVLPDASLQQGRHLSIEYGIIQEIPLMVSAIPGFPGFQESELLGSVTIPLSTRQCPYVYRRQWRPKWVQTMGHVIWALGKLFFFICFYFDQIMFFCIYLGCNIQMTRKKRSWGQQTWAQNDARHVILGPGMFFYLCVSYKLIIYI